MTNQYFEEWYTEFITPRGYLLETRGIKSFLKEAWDAGAASQQAEPACEHGKPLAESCIECGRLEFAKAEPTAKWSKCESWCGEDCYLNGCQKAREHWQKVHAR